MDIKQNSLTSGDVKDGTLRMRDINENARQGGVQGPRGEQGPAGVGRWALADATGAIVAQSGGFTVTAGYPTLENTAPEGSPSNAQRANGNVYINANEDLTDNGIVATVALQNTVDQNGDAITSGRAPGADNNPEFSGEIATSLCLPGTVNCAPPGTSNINYLVVSPRLSDGSVTMDGNHKRFYVVVTGDSTDFVASSTP